MSTHRAQSRTVRADAAFEPTRRARTASYGRIHRTCGPTVRTDPPYARTHRTHGPIGRVSPRAVSSIARRGDRCAGGCAAVARNDLLILAEQIDKRQRPLAPKGPARPAAGQLTGWSGRT